MKNAIKNIGRITSLLYFIPLLILFFLCSMIFSIMFFTNGAFKLDKDTLINIDGINGLNIPLLLLVICLEFSKIGMVLYRPFLKNKRMFDTSKKLLNIILLMSIIASISFTMLTDNSLNVGLKFVNMIDNYFSLWIFKKHFVLLVNCSLCIIVELLIIQLPQFIINLFIDKDLVSESKSYFSRILKILNDVINFKITRLEQKFIKYTDQSNIISEDSTNKHDEIQLKREKIIDNTERRNINTKVLKLLNIKSSLDSCDEEYEKQQPNIITKFDNIKKLSPIGFKSKNKSSYTLGNLAIKSNVNDDFSKDELIEYLTYIYNNKNENISPGQSKISKNTDLSYRKIKAIRYYLEDKGVLKIDDKITYLIIDTFEKTLKMLELED